MKELKKRTGLGLPSTTFSLTKSGAGFTLIEMLLGIFIFTIIAVGLTALVSGVLTSSNKQSDLLADAQQSRRLAFGMVNQLRNAQTSATGAYPLATAGDQTLTFYSDIDNDALVEQVRYYVQDGKLYQGVTKPSGNPPGYSQANERKSVIQNDLANNASPLFYYYDGGYDGAASAPLTQPVNVTRVRFIKLDLKVYKKAGVTNTNSYAVTASGAIRNLKDNLGEGANQLIQYQLATQVLPAGVGSVAVSPTGPVYYGNTLVNLNAYSNLGYGFTGWTGNVSQPDSQATTIVMNNDYTVIANFTAIPQTLTGSIPSKSGSTNARRWNLRINNTNNFTVNSVNLYAFSLAQTAGPACSPVIAVPAAFPAPVGNIGANSSRTYQATINFTGCQSSTRFTANFSFAGNNGAQWGSASIINQAQ